MTSDANRDGSTRTSLRLTRKSHARRGQSMRSIATVIALVLLTSPGWAQQPPTPPKADKNDRKLSDKLLNKSGERSDESVMEVVIRLMNDAAARLEIRFDTGEGTLELQDSILKRLDEAIELAASQRNPSRNNQKGSTGDRRQQPKRQNAQTKQARTEQGEGEGQSDDNAQSDHAKGAVTNPKPGGDMLDTRRGWGHLPQRERDEIIQGVGERYLQRYRTWIEKYYRALRDRDDGSRP